MKNTQADNPTIQFQLKTSMTPRLHNKVEQRERIGNRNGQFQWRSNELLFDTLNMKP